MQKTAVIYTRVSTDDQAENGYSLRDQEIKLKKYCRDNNIEILKHYQDDYSAKDFNRPKFKEFQNDIRLKTIKPDIFLCARIDRFSRNAYATMSMLEDFKEWKIKLKLLDGDFDSDQPESLLMNLFKIALPQIENERRGLNTKNGMRQARREGRWMGTAPKGYLFSKESGKPLLKPNSDSKYIIKAFQEVAKGMEATDHIRFLLRKQGFNCSKNQFYNILRNKVYIGKIVIEAFKNEPEEIVLGLHDPLISEAIFNQVQDILEGRKKKQPKLGCKDENLPLRGFLVCPACKANLTGSGSVNRNKVIYHYYHCQNGCKIRFRADEANEMFIRYLGKLKVPEEIIELYLRIIEDMFKEDDKGRDEEINNIQNELLKIDDRLESLADKYVENSIDQDTFKRTRVRYEEHKNKLLDKKLDLENVDTSFMRYLRFGSILLKNLPTYYQEADFEVKRKIVGSIFPEKLIFENSKYRTTKSNELLSLFNMKINKLAVNKKGLTTISDDQSYKAPPLGLEPRTP